MKILKEFGNHNPVMTQRFGADPYVLIYDDTVYLYMTGDDYEYNQEGNMTTNTYSKINTLNVIASKDLVNWTDYGTIYAASERGATKWGNNSWAPAAAWKMIDGKPKFFLYYANSGNGIAVATSDSPVGPFVDPLGKALISRSTPTCASVTWLFDPAVLQDDDGNCYIYFGGGVPGRDAAANPGTARVAKLGADMISLDGDPRPIENVEYLFEDSGINKINGKYVYSYCSNFSVPDEVADEVGFHNGEIVTMVSDDPMGPFTKYKMILKNPQFYFGRGGNNHHCMFNFKNQWYMAYHTRILEEAMGIDFGYRSTNIDKVNIHEDGTIELIEGTKAGVPAVASFNPYEKNKAVTAYMIVGADTTQYGEISKKYGCGEMIVTNIEDGAYIGVSGAEFGDKGADSIDLEVRGKDAKGSILVYLNGPDKELVGKFELPALSDDFKVYTTKLSKKVTGKQDIYFVMEGTGFEFSSWMFH